MESNYITRETLARIDEALTSGTRTLSIGEKSVTFHSLEELIKLRNQVDRFLSGRVPLKVSVPTVTKDGGHHDLS